MASVNRTCKMVNGNVCKIKNKSTQEKDQCNGDQTEKSASDYLRPDIRKKIEEVVESKGITDYTVLIEPGSSVGDNFVGYIRKVTITGLDKNKENTTLNWIVKEAPYTDVLQKFINVELLYQREVFMYKTIFPALAKFQEEKSVLESFNSYPKFVFAHLAQYQHCFGMENVKCEGYVMRDRKQPLNWHHVKLVMKTYATFHAASLAMRDQKLEFAELRNKMHDVLTAHQGNEYALKMFQPFVQMAFEALNSATDQRPIKKIEIFLTKFIDIFHETVNMTNEISVISHGDSWVNNMLWKYDDPNDQTKPTNVCLLDFQLSRYGSPVYDLTHFLFACTDKAFRDKHYDDAIKLYYYTVCCQLVEMGSDPEKVFPFSALERDLKRFSIVGMFMSFMALSIITRDSDEFPDRKNSNMTAEDRNDQWVKQRKNKDVYNKRVCDVITDMWEKGYLDFIE